MINKILLYLALGMPITLFLNGLAIMVLIVFYKTYIGDK